ncbi:MAG: hemolysin III family protein [Zetaproteobacteria bacterium]|nr:MAG: hemolysin III family protein [Zetaproteobacteria bacterium]
MRNRHDTVYYGEKFNSISHLLGAIAATVGLVILVVTAVRSGDVWSIVSCSIYGATLMNLYLASTLYHSIRGWAKPFLLKLDHLSIYLLIAGTYTPFTLVSLRGGWGWSLFGIEWGLALLGMTLDMLHRKGSRAVQVTIYLLMGWLIAIALPALLQVLPDSGIALLLAGGVFYTVGIIFYGIDERMRHAHGIWHLFVLAGSACHYFAILLYVA